MSESYPIRDRIFVLRDEERQGPFTVDELLLGLDEGRFRLEDVCLREGAIDTERLHDLLDWEETAPEAGPVTTVPRRDSPPVEPTSSETEEPGPTTPRDDAGPQPGELLYSGHPSILTYPSLPGLVLGFVGAAWLFPIDTSYALIALGVALLSLVHLGYARFTRDYLVTTGRVEVISGLIARSSNEIRIADIRAINVKCKGWAGLLGIGTVDFFTIGDRPEVTFERAWKARAIKELVRDLQDRVS